MAKKNSSAIPRYDDEQLGDFVAELTAIAATMWQYRTGLSIDSDRRTDFGELLDKFFTGELDAPEKLFVCQNCESRWAEEELNEVKDLAERVAPGELVPAGECPECGAVCHEET